MRKCLRQMMQPPRESLLFFLVQAVQRDQNLAEEAEMMKNLAFSSSCFFAVIYAMRTDRAFQYFAHCSETSSCSLCIYRTFHCLDWNVLIVKRQTLLCAFPSRVWYEYHGYRTRARTSDNTLIDPV